MLIIVVAGLAACGGAVFCVLDAPVARDRQRNAMLSVVLLAATVAICLTAIAYGMTAWLVS